MRTIKFRGKDLNTQEWVCGDLHTLCDKPHIHTEVSAFPYAGKRSFVDPETIGQFTGYRDKNGKEIYEGDIIKCIKGQKRKPASDEWEADCDTYAVKYKFGSFTGISLWSLSLDYVEVIGNIHDNPELLKEDTD